MSAKQKKQKDWERLHTIPELIIPGLARGTEQWIKGPLRVLFSPIEHHRNAGLWKHASVSCRDRYPTWEEILEVRYRFFGEEEEVFQILPPKSEYITFHQNCFHLWCAIGRRLTPG